MDFLVPNSLEEALEMRKRKPEFAILAGGTDVCTLINGGFILPKGLISIWGLEDLSGIVDCGEFIEVGALTTHSQITESNLIKKNLPALVDACKTVGARQIQNRGTIGGNVMNASPAGDSLPVLLAYETEVELASKAGVRAIPFPNFYTGYRTTVLKEDEILTKFRIKKALPGERGAFLKIGARKAQAISKVMACFRITYNKTVKEVALAFGSVAAFPVRAPKTEKFLTEKVLNEETIYEALEILNEEISPIDDIRSTAEYRRHVCRVLLKRFLIESA